MKKVFALLIVFALSSMAFAQEHMQFKGISMGLTTSEMATKLKSQGYKQTGFENGIYALEGDFAGKSGCTIAIYPGVKDATRMVAVSYPAQSSWSSLTRDFNDVAETLNNKYGKPSRTLREFEYPYKLGDGDEMYAISAKKVSYANVYATDNGNVILMIYPASVRGTAAISVGYTDKINSDALDAAKNAQAYDDL